MQLLCTEGDDFRLGIQKCRKTIRNNLKDDSIFEAEGMETLFEEIAKISEEESEGSTHRLLAKSDQFFQSQVGDLLEGGIENDDNDLLVNDAVIPTSTVIAPSNNNSEVSETPVVAATVAVAAANNDDDEDEEDESSMAFSIVNSSIPPPTPPILEATPDRNLLLPPIIGGGLNSRKGKKRISTTTQLFIKSPKSTDRLSIDKEYLALLAYDLGGQRNSYGKKVAGEAHETLTFLKSQDKFWKQMQLKRQQ